jgi:hypothetical protein
MNKEELNEDTAIERGAHVFVLGSTAGGEVGLGSTLLWIKIECNETIQW